MSRRKFYSLHWFIVQVKCSHLTIFTVGRRRKSPAINMVPSEICRYRRLLFMLSESEISFHRAGNHSIHLRFTLNRFISLWSTVINIIIANKSAAHEANSIILWGQLADDRIVSENCPILFWLIFDDVLWQKISKFSRKCFINRKHAV